MERNAYDMISNGSILPGNIFWRGGGGGGRGQREMEEQGAILNISRANIFKAGRKEQLDVNSLNLTSRPFSPTL